MDPSATPTPADPSPSPSASTGGLPPGFDTLHSDLNTLIVIVLCMAVLLLVVAGIHLVRSVW